MLYEREIDLRRSLQGILAIDGNEVILRDPDRLREKLIDRLLYNALFHPSEGLRTLLIWLIRKAAAGRGIYPASLHSLYRGGPPPFTVPAFAPRGLSYEFARALLRAQWEAVAGPILFAIQDGADDSLTPAEHSACILAAAVREGYAGPLFLLADDLRLDPYRHRSDPTGELDRLRTLIEERLDAGYFNFNLETTALTDYGEPDLEAGQRRSAAACAELAHHLRLMEPEGITSALAGEIGEVGRRADTVRELRAFTADFTTALADRMPEAEGLARLVLRTGGGPMDLGEEAARGVIDLRLLRDLAEVARREYGIACSVRGLPEGLPSDSYRAIAEAGVPEILIPLRYETLLFEHPAFPEPFRAEIERWIDGQLAPERRPGQSDLQFLRYGYKRALGAFKRRIWELPEGERAAIREEAQRRALDLIDLLGLRGRDDFVRAAVEPRAVPPKPPVSGFHHTAEARWEDELTRLGEGIFPRPGYPAGSHPVGRER